MTGFKKLSLITAAVGLVAVGTAFLASSQNDDARVSVNSQPALNTLVENINPSTADNREALTAILTELQYLRADINELNQRLSDVSSINNSEGQGVETNGWWNNQTDFDKIGTENSTYLALTENSPRKEDYESEEEYQQGIRDFQAKLDEQALSGIPLAAAKREQAERLERARRLVEQDLGSEL